MRDRTKKLLIGFATVVLVLFAFIVPAYYANTEIEQLTCTVTDKYQDNTHSNQQYIVLTTSCGTMRVADSVLDWKFDERAIFDRIVIGDAYRFTVEGLRVPWLNLYPNIIAVEPA